MKRYLINQLITSEVKGLLTGLDVFYIFNSTRNDDLYDCDIYLENEGWE